MDIFYGSNIAITAQILRQFITMYAP